MERLSLDRPLPTRFMRKLVTYLLLYGPTPATELKRKTCDGKGTTFRIAREHALKLGLIEYKPFAPTSFAEVSIHRITKRGRRWVAEPTNGWSFGDELRQ